MRVRPCLAHFAVSWSAGPRHNIERFQYCYSFQNVLPTNGHFITPIVSTNHSYNCFLTTRIPNMHYRYSEAPCNGNFIAHSCEPNLVWVSDRELRCNTIASCLFYYNQHFVHSPGISGHSVFVRYSETKHKNDQLSSEHHPCSQGVAQHSIRRGGGQPSRIVAGHSGALTHAFPKCDPIL